MSPLLKKEAFAHTCTRMEEQIYALARFTSTPSNGVTRIVYSEVDRQAKKYVKGVMSEIGLEVWEDAIGNIFGRLKGSDPTLPPIWSGSHLDAVPHGGMFDGVVGVLSAVEALRVLKENDLHTKRDIVAVIFSSEEPTLVGVGCLGSRAMVGTLNEKDLQTLTNSEGQSLYEVMHEAGYHPENLSDVLRQRGDIGAFIELHIEQGIVLERGGHSIGLVHAIAGPTDIELILEGEQQHAGATPMSLRKDPVPAVAEIILAVEAWAKQNASEHTVATVGSMQIVPGASNVIANHVRLSIDSRDVNWLNKEKFLNEIQKIVRKICAQRGIHFQMKVKAHDQPMTAHPLIVQKLEKACSTLGIDYKLMASGAYHDALMMASIAPFGMIFVPSKQGISHDKREWTEFKQITEGVKVLTHSLYELANSLQI